MKYSNTQHVLTSYSQSCSTLDPRRSTAFRIVCTNLDSYFDMYKRQLSAYSRRWGATLPSPYELMLYV